AGGADPWHPGQGQPDCIQPRPEHRFRHARRRARGGVSADSDARRDSRLRAPASRARHLCRLRPAEAHRLVSRRADTSVECTLRDYRASDFETLWKIDQACFAPDLAYSRSELGGYIRRRSSVTVVAEQAGEIIAYIVAEHVGRKAGHIITLDVLERARRG